MDSPTIGYSTRATILQNFRHGVLLFGCSCQDIQWLKVAVSSLTNMGGDTGFGKVLGRQHAFWWICVLPSSIRIGRCNGARNQSQESRRAQG
jgi:hypothetical protein